MNPQTRQCDNCKISKVEYDMTKGRNWCKQCTNGRAREYRVQAQVATVPPVPQSNISQQLATIDQRTSNIEQTIQTVNLNVQKVSTDVSETKEALNEALENGKRIVEEHSLHITEIRDNLNSLIVHYNKLALNYDQLYSYAAQHRLVPPPQAQIKEI